MIRKQIFLIGLILNITIVNAQTKNINSSNYLSKKIRPINVDLNYRNGNWNPVLKEVKTKRIVLLGELNHGSKEVFISRSDLIKALHENLGFNVILFESGIGELAAIDLQKEMLTSKEMTNGFFGNWRTKEFQDLMSFVKSENISIAGFDVQRTGGSFKYLLKELCEDKEIDTIFIDNLEDRYGLLQRELSGRNVTYDSVASKTNKLIEDYQNLYSLLIKKSSEDTSKKFLFSTKTILNRMNYLQYMLQFVKDRNWNKRWTARDSVMAENIEWLIEKFYEKEKIIVIAHNYHISKFNEKEVVMGEFLKVKYAAEIYSLGVFAGKGKYLGNSGNEEKLMPASEDELDIKHIIFQLDGRINFLDIPKNKNKKSTWLFNKIIVNDTFIDLSGANELVLSKSFDGLLFIDEISTPEKN